MVAYLVRQALVSESNPEQEHPSVVFFGPAVLCRFFDLAEFVALVERPEHPAV